MLSDPFSKEATRCFWKLSREFSPHIRPIVRLLEAIPPVPMESFIGLEATPDWLTVALAARDPEIRPVSDTNGAI